MTRYKPESLTKLFTELERHYSRAHDKMRRADGIYNKHFRNLPQLPATVPVHESSFGRNLVDNLRDQIRVDQPTISFRERGASQAALRHKELMERWGQNVMQQLAHHSQIDPAQQAKHDLFLRGAACIKWVHDANVLPVPPERSEFKSTREYTRALKQWRAHRAELWPFVVRPLDPLLVFPSPGRELRYVLEMQDRRVIDVWAEYGDKFSDLNAPRKGDTPFRTVRWLEYWSAPVYVKGKLVDPGWYIIEVDGERIIDEENPYWHVPYAFSYSGLGRSNYDADPEYLAENVLEPIVGELEAEVRIKTAADAQWQMHVFPTGLTTEDPKAVREQLSKGPGRIIKVPDVNASFKWLESPPPNPQMMQFLGAVNSAIANRYPPALMQRQAGVDAAVHDALLYAKALKPVAPVKNSLDRMMTQVLRGLAQIIVALKLDMNVYATAGEQEADRMVASDDFKSFEFEAHYEATDATEDDRRLLTGVSVLREQSASGMPVMSRRTFREVYAKRIMPDSDEEEERIMTEMAIDQAIAAGILTAPLVEEMQAAQEQEANAALAAQQAAKLSEKAQARVPGARERALASMAEGTRVAAREEAGAGMTQAGIGRAEQQGR